MVKRYKAFKEGIMVGDIGKKDSMSMQSKIQSMRQSMKKKKSNEGYEGRPDGRLPLGKRNQDHPIMKSAAAAVKTLPPSKPLKDLFKKKTNENFMDGKNPQDKGDSKRHGVPTKSSVSNLRKVAKQGGRKGQLAHWMANMKAGRAKKKRKG